MAPKAKSKARPRSVSSGPGAAKAKAKARAKAAAAPPAAGHSDTPAAVLTLEAEAARCLQASARSFLAAVRLCELRASHAKHEADVAEAARAAELALLRRERAQAEAARQRDQEKRAKAKKLREDTQRMLSCAFEGDAASLSQALEDGLHVDARDVKGTTALSEAAAGGAPNVVQLLLNHKGNPNSRGEFARTPLWRAAYAGHAEVALLLLESGGDPRLYDEQGCAPADVTSADGLLGILREWDISRTDALVEELEGWLEDQRLEDDFRRKEATRSVDMEYEQARAANEAAQGALARAKVEFRNIVREHGAALAAGQLHAGWKQAQQACEWAEERATRAEVEATSAQARVDRALTQRMAAVEALNAAGAGAACSPGSLLGREVPLRRLNDVLLRDVGGHIAGSDKWPLLVDPSDCGKKLLVYAGCSVLNFWRPEEMDPNQVRLALLAMIRGGGIMAIDLCCFGGGVSRDLLAEPFDRVRAGLFGDLLSRGLLATPKGDHWPLFQKLVRSEEKASFGKEHFDEGRTSRFKFAVVTSTDVPHRELLECFDVLHVTPGELGE